MSLADDIARTVARQEKYYILKPMEFSHECTCGGSLHIAITGGEADYTYVLRCGKCGHISLDAADPMVVKLKSLRQLWKEGVGMRLDVAQNFERKQGGKPMESTAIQAMSQAAMLKRIEVAKFPKQLTPAEKSLLAEAARTYGLDPLMGELTIFQGRPYVSIDGRRRKAQETKVLAGIKTRPATKQEKEDWGYPQEDYFFHADIFLKGLNIPFEGWGRVSKAEVDRAIAAARANNSDPWHIPLVKDPQGMAEKRAEVKGLRRAFHIPLPSTEEIGGEAEEEAPKVLITVEPPASLADPETGEVIEEGEVVEQVSGKALDHEPTGSDKAFDALKSASAVYHETITSVGNLLQRALALGLAPKEVEKIAGVEHRSQIIDLEGTWQKVLAHIEKGKKDA